MCTGMMWQWDLTAALGWQAAARHWYGQGSWLVHAKASWLAAEVPSGEVCPVHVF